MSRRHTNRPVERLRSSAWTDTSDLEETMAKMFPVHLETERNPGQIGTVVETGTVPPPQTIDKARPLQTGTVPLNGGVPFSTTDPCTTAVPFNPDPRRPRTRIFRATRVEHGHTPGERIILQSLWNKAIGNDRERTIRIGYDRLATLASVNWKTARACLRSLEQKLAIETLEPENSNSREGRLYRIYGFDLILERRKQAGLEWVQKGRGVEFLQTGTVPSSTTAPRTGPVPSSGSGTAPVTGADTVPVIGAPLRNPKKTEETTSLRVVLQKQLPTFDHAAVNQLWRECRHQVPDITVEEIASLFRQKLDSQPRGIENQNGFLMRAVVRGCTTAAVAMLRQGRESPRESDAFAERAVYWQRRAAYWETLNDPNASEDEKRVARGALATMRETQPPDGS